MVSRTFARKQFLEILLVGLTPIQKMCIWRELAETLEIILRKYIEDEALARIFEEKCHEIIKRETSKEKDNLINCDLVLSCAEAKAV